MSNKKEAEVISNINSQEEELKEQTHTETNTESKSL